MQDLQEYAQKWAEHMAGKNDFNHSNCKLNGQSIGENIAYTGSSRPTDYAGNQSALSVSLCLYTHGPHIWKRTVNIWVGNSVYY